MRNGLLLVGTLALLGACVRLTPADRVPVESSPDALVQSGQPITRFAVEFTPAAQKLVDEDQRFNSIDLRDAIVAELTARQMMTQQPGSGRAAVLQVDDFSVHHTSNVAIMGRVASEGVLAGTVRIREPAGETKEHRTLARIAMKVSTKDADKKPLKNFYKAFARQLADELAGVPPLRR